MGCKAKGNTLLASEVSHTLDARATDNSGDFKRASRIAVKVGNVDNLPTTSIVRPINGSNIAQAVLVHVSVTEERAVSSASYALDNGAWQAASYNT